MKQRISKKAILSLLPLLCSCGKGSEIIEKHLTVLEAEMCVLENCQIEMPDEEKKASNNGCVSHQQVGTTITFYLDAGKGEEDVSMKSRLSCPLAWIDGEYNLPQNIYFSDVYTLTQNGEDITLNHGEIHLNGSILEEDNYNYFYWVEACFLVTLEEENIFTLSVTNLGGRSFSSFGNVDCFTFQTVTEINFDKMKR